MYKRQELSSVFFYREGVYNANQLTSPASDEFDLVRGWQQLNAQHGVALNICVAAALRRGIVDETEAGRLGLASSNLQSGFTLSGLGALAEASLTCDRAVSYTHLDVYKRQSGFRFCCFRIWQ